MDERVPGMAGSRVDHEAWGLVDDEQIGVLKKNIERDILRLEEGRLGGRFREDDGLALVQFFAWFRRFALDGGVALLDEGLEPRPGKVGQLAGEESVKPIPRRACIDSELRHLPQ